MITYKRILLSLLLAVSAAGATARAPATDWDKLRERNRQMGFTSERMELTIRSCRAYGLTMAQAEELLDPLYSAYSENLPTDCIFLKIEEGLAKHVAWQEVLAQADKRLAHARTADSLSRSIPLKPCEPREHLVSHICMALESGLPVEVLEDLFRHEGSARTRRLVYIVTAGEALQLAGLAPDDTRHILLDCMDRDLSCTEVGRVVEMLQDRSANGVPFDEIHAELWVRSDR